MKRLFLILILCTACVALFITCSDKSTTPGDPLSQLKARIAQTPRVDAEAEMAALWLSRELVAPETLYAQVRDGLSELRSEFGDSISSLWSVHFRAPGICTGIVVYLTDSVYRELTRGDYHEWDDLNQLYRLESLDTSSSSEISLYYATLHFKGLIRSDSLAEKYKSVQGITRVESITPSGDWPNLYPWVHESGLTFLLRLAWMDCDLGCIYSHFWYFKEIQSHWQYIGDYTLNSDAPASPPDWYSEASKAFNAFRQSGS